MRFVFWLIICVFDFTFRFLNQRSFQNRIRKDRIIIELNFNIDLTNWGGEIDYNVLDAVNCRKFGFINKNFKRAIFNHSGPEIWKGNLLQWFSFLNCIKESTRLQYPIFSGFPSHNLPGLVQELFCLQSVFVLDSLNLLRLFIIDLLLLSI